MREHLNMVYHIVGGFILILLVLWQPVYASGVGGFVFGWLREQSYEYGQMRERQHLGYRIAHISFKQAWWHWQTPHKLWEAAHWGIGAQAAAVVAVFVL